MINVADLKKDRCTGCRYCEKVCPKNAIKMKTDEWGYLYPSVTEDCISCGKCIRECPYGMNKELIEPSETYAAVRKNNTKRMESSSGGVFACIAENLLKKGEWYVSGCVLDLNFHPKQMITSDMKILKEMYGSKYVQCDMENIYEEIIEKLTVGYKVLFSGTPCQVNAIKKYVKNDENLYTLELICHGVTNEEMFKSYINNLSRKKIKHFIFRDKNQGWSFNSKVIFEDGTSRNINHRLNSYMTYYLNCELYRDSCYSCEFAKSKRGADLTIGDFWGIINKRPELKDKLDIENGVSCLLVNTSKGRELLKAEELDLYPVALDDIKSGNEPLNHPSVHTEKRNKLLNVWGDKDDWKDVDDYWKENDYKYRYYLWSLLPPYIQHYVRVLLRKR